MRTRVIIVIDVTHHISESGHVENVVESYVDHGTFREGLDLAFEGSGIDVKQLEIVVTP